MRRLLLIVLIVSAVLCIGICAHSVLGGISCSIDGNHNFVGYYYDDQYHWQTCTLCGKTFNKSEHDVGESLENGERQCTLCGYSELLSDYAYKVTFICEDAASIVVYGNRDYTVDGTESALAYSKDGSTGELLKDGEGEVNFKVLVSDGYFVSDIVIGGNYRNRETIDDNDDIYRITKIKSDLTVNVTVLPSANIDVIYNFASTTTDNGGVSFSWNLVKGYAVSGIICEVAKGNGDSVSSYYLGDVTLWTYWMNMNTLYSFKFSAISVNSKVTFNDYTCSRYALSGVDALDFARVEINTEGGVFPSCDYVSAPSGCWGSGITDAKYLQSTIDIYDSSNTLQYSIKDSSGAKIKIRGNTSAYGEKPSYKIKLSSAADILAGFVERGDGVNYADKEWILLSSGNRLAYVVGSAVNRYLGVEWSPAYTYVTLFINGDYRGLYILCEAINEGNSSEDDYSKMTVDNDGYIIELDPYWWNEDLYFTTEYTENSAVKYTFKYPDSDKIDENSEEYQYIKHYVDIVEQKIIDNADDLGDYIDFESFAVWLLTHGYLSTCDSGGSNLYFVKKDSGNSLLAMGPTWDYDSIYWRTESYGRIYYDTSFWFRYLFENEEFMAVYNELFEKTKDTIFDYIVANIDGVKTVAYAQLVAVEVVRWKSNIESVQSVIDFFTKHIEWMNSQLSE